MKTVLALLPLLALLLASFPLPFLLAIRQGSTMISSKVSLRRLAMKAPESKARARKLLVYEVCGLELLVFEV